MVDTSNEIWPEYHPAAIAVLKGLIVVIEIGCMWGQVVLVVASGDFIQMYPEFTPARWPYAIAGVFGVLCFEAALVPLWRLLTLVKRRDVFSGKAVTWTNAIIVCALAEAAVVVFVLLYGSLAQFPYRDPSSGRYVDLAMGSAALGLACLAALLLIAAFVLLLVVMRSLLVTAIEQRNELAEVI